MLTKGYKPKVTSNRLQRLSVAYKNSRLSPLIYRICVKAFRVTKLLACYKLTICYLSSLRHSFLSLLFIGISNWPFALKVPYLFFYLPPLKFTLPLLSKGHDDAPLFSRAQIPATARVCIQFRASSCVNGCPQHCAPKAIEEQAHHSVFSPLPMQCLTLAMEIRAILSKIAAKVACMQSNRRGQFTVLPPPFLLLSSKMPRGNLMLPIAFEKRMPQGFNFVLIVCHVVLPSGCN